ncbi:Crp/Fnr family transcriptional regulator [Xylocopilactobacillus apis]|uniref:Cyclic nucleotide-binding protein n=1 Tax=Xylocopilactobacillus apis TaxID=2932183 RepID=A0AAU9DU90_9LACO|nr:Crp/Fnr family transcriptional regulator [Xylocopilactobacillus apis]BDR57393.1 cyclic nucleotide-binding protein [Xylocopilactobacillus apis]
MKNQNSNIDQFGSSFPVFYQLSKSAQELLSKNLNLHKVTLETAKTIAPGEINHYMYFLLSGSAKIFQVTEEGKEYLLYRLYPGEVCVLSAESILKGKAFPAFLNLEQEAHVVAIPEEIFRELFNTENAWKEFILSEMADKILLLFDLVENHLFKNNEQRLLLYLKENVNSKTLILEMTHNELAAELGTAREVVSRLLKKIEQQGIIKLARKRITILDYDKLNNT